MDKNTDILHEAKRLRLIAAALELQHYTSTASNVLPIPGGDRVIFIGTRADVVRYARQEAALQALADQAQELDMGYGPAAATDSEGGHHD